MSKSSKWSFSDSINQLRFFLLFFGSITCLNFTLEVRRMNKRILVSFVTVLLLAIALVGCGKNESDKAANTDAEKRY